MFARHHFGRIVGTAIAVAAVGLSTSGIAAADATSEEFLRNVAADGVHFGPEAAVIQRAQVVCTAFSASRSPATVYPRLLNTLQPFSPEQAALFIADAVQAYCPRYADLLVS
jgi:hypothetical protein